ncbi:hypothetical protein Tco_0093047 [Tanacetum coccineum]
MDEPHPAYNFFAPVQLPGYAGNPNNNNGWIEADVPLLEELGEKGEPQGAKVDEPMVVHAIEEVAEPLVEAEEQMVALVIDIEEDLATLFGGDDDFEDDDSEGFDEEEVWEVNEDWLMAPVTPPPMLVVPPPSIYEVRGPSTVADEGPSFPFPAPRLPVPPSVMASQIVQAVDRKEQIDIQMKQGQQTKTQRDEVIEGLTQQVQALQAECIIGMDRRLAELEKKKPPGPQ